LMATGIKEKLPIALLIFRSREEIMNGGINSLHFPCISSGSAFTLRARSSVNAVLPAGAYFVVRKLVLNRKSDQVLCSVVRYDVSWHQIVFVARGRVVVKKQFSSQCDCVCLTLLLGYKFRPARYQGSSRFCEAARDV